MLKSGIQSISGFVQCDSGRFDKAALWAHPTHMKNDIPPAAMRLLSALPVRTIERRPPERPKPNLGNPAPVRGRAVLFGKGGVARPVRVGGITFLSATEAARKMRKSTAKIYEWLRKGEAEYA